MTHRKPYHRWVMLCMVLIFGGQGLSALAQDGAGRCPDREPGNKRIALIIGNDAYQKVSKLEKAGNDAAAMARELTTACFDVVLHKDLNYRAMVKAVQTLTERITGGDQVVVFFAGHGVQIKTGNYLLPVDIEASSEGEIEKTAYALEDLTDKLREAKASFALVLVDACRDNPIRSKGRSVGNSRGLSAVEPPKGQIVVFSASKGQQALDRLSDNDNNPNGVFTREFIKRMKQPGVRIEEMMREVQDSVETLAQSISHDQRPAVYNESRGNFYFFGPTTVQVQGGTTTVDPESETWQAAERANSLAGYQTYFDAFPKGRYAAAAKIAIDALKRNPVSTTATKPVAATPTASTDPETQFWNEVKTSGAREYLDAYLKLYPKGKYLALAKVEFKKLDDQDKANQARAQAEAQIAQERERQEGQRAEQTTWEDAKASNTSAAYSAYLSRYPQGRYATLAYPTQQRLQREEAQKAEQIKQQQADAALREEQEVWDKAQAANTLAGLTGYLSRYPQGRFAAQALPERQRLQREETQRAEQQAAVREEQDAWRKAESANDSATVQDYLNRYPSGSNAGLAQTKLAQIKRLEAEIRPGKVFKDCVDCPEMVVAGSGIAAMVQMTPIGLWKTISDKDGSVTSEVRIVEKDGVLSGKIARDWAPKANPATDKCTECKDDRKDQLISGLEIIRGAKKVSDKDVWEDGKILDPASGKNFALRLTPIEAGKKLEVRGSIGFFGRTQVWIRAE